MVPEVLKWWGGQNLVRGPMVWWGGQKFGEGAGAPPAPPLATGLGELTAEVNSPRVNSPGVNSPRTQCP